MAIDYGISSLDAGASDITYSGNEGPKSPQEEQQMMLAQLEQEYEQYRMEQMEIDPSKVLPFEEWYQMTYEASRQGVADGGIMRTGYAKGRWGDSGPMSPGTRSDYSPGQGHRENVGGPPSISAGTKAQAAKFSGVPLGGQLGERSTRPTPIQTKRPNEMLFLASNPTFQKKKARDLYAQRFKDWQDYKYPNQIKTSTDDEDRPWIPEWMDKILNTQEKKTRRLDDILEGNVQKKPGTLGFEDWVSTNKATLNQPIWNQQAQRWDYTTKEPGQMSNIARDYSAISGWSPEIFDVMKAYQAGGMEGPEIAKSLYDSLSTDSRWKEKMNIKESNQPLMKTLEQFSAFPYPQFTAEQKKLSPEIQFQRDLDLERGEYPYGWKEGGIARLGYDMGGNVRQRPHQPSDLLVRNTLSGERPKYQPPGRDYGGPPGGGATSRGSGRDVGRRSDRANIGGPPGGGSGGAGGTMYYKAPDPDPDPDPRTSPHGDTPGYIPEDIPKKEKDYYRDEHKKYLEKARRHAKIKNIKSKGTWAQKGLYGLLPNDPKLAYDFLNTLKDDDQETWNSLPQELKNLIEGPPSLTAPGGKLDFDEWSTLSQVPGYGEFLKERGKPGVFHSGDIGELGDRFVQKDEFGNVIKDKFGNIKYGYHEPTGGRDDQPLWARLGYRSESEWRNDGGGGGGGGDGETTPDPEDPVIPTDPVTTGPFTNQYHIPGAANFYTNLASALPTGQTTGVTFDPTSEMLKYYMADGGRVPAAYGGIMGDDGRRRYGLGSMFKKAFKAVKKVAKSPVGKMALMVGLGGLGGFGPAAGLKGSALGKFLMGTGLPTGVPGTGGPSTGLLGKMLLNKGTGWSMANISPWKAIGGLSALGGLYTGMTDDDDDENELYKKWLAEKQAADAYWTPRFDAAFPAADGGRIGYAGGYMVDDDEEDLHRTAALSAMYRSGAQEGGLMDMGGMEKDYRNDGGFVPIGGQERADDVPARLSKNEFVFTADAVRAAGGGDIDAGAEVMENLMENLEQGGQVSEESQGLEGARNMFATAQRLEGVL